MVSGNKRQLITLVSATLTIVGTVIAYKLTVSLSTSQSWGIVLAWMAAGIIVTYLVSRLQARSQEESSEAIKERVNQLEQELRKQVQARSYGARRQLIEAPLRKLDLDITPRVGWVRDPRLVEPEPISEKIADDIVAAFESSTRRMLIVGEPGSGKTMAAYSLIEYLDNTAGDQRIPLLVNLSAWEAQDSFEAFLVDYLCSSIGYQVRQRAVANAFVSSRRYTLILDGLDEIPAKLRAHFSERLDEFVRGLSSEVAVVVTCRTQEYEELLASHSTGLGLVQAVEILPLISQQLDSAFVELAQRDKDWETFLSQRHLTAYKRVRHLLSNPLFLNLAVVGHLSPEQLLDSTTTEQELRDLVLESYVDRTLADQKMADQKHYEPDDARRYLTWIARFLNRDEDSPFGCKTSDATVFDLANLTPSEPPTRHRLFGALAAGLVVALVSQLVQPLIWVLGGEMSGGLWVVGWVVSVPLVGLIGALVLGLVMRPPMEMIGVLVFSLSLTIGLLWWLELRYSFHLARYSLVLGLSFGLVGGLLNGWPYKRSAVSSRLTPVRPSTRQHRRDFARRAGRGLALGLVGGLVFGLVLNLFSVLASWLIDPVPYADLVGELIEALVFGLVVGSLLGLILGPVFGLIEGLFETRSVLITSRTPKEANSRSLIAALVLVIAAPVGALVLTLIGVLAGGWVTTLFHEVGFLGVSFGLVVGLVVGLNNGGWFVLLQKVAHRHLARAGNLAPRPYDFLEWGIDKQIFRRVGSGVRFRHNLIQQHLASTSADAGK